MLNSFRELLLRKATDPRLKALIQAADERYLIDQIFEKLQKAANPLVGRNANAISRLAASHIVPHPESGARHPITEMLYDQASHHASNAKNAVRRMNARHPQDAPNIANDKKVAGQHYLNLMRTVDLMGNVYPHMKHADTHEINAIPPTQWIQRMHPERRADKPSEFSHIAKSWAGHETYRNKPEMLVDAFAGGPLSFSGKHKAHGLGPQSPYPFHMITVGGRHLDMPEPKASDLSGPSKFTSHPADTHPLYEHFHKPQKHLRAADVDSAHQQILAAHDPRNPNSLISKFIQHLQERHPDINTHHQRGQEMPQPIHHDLGPDAGADVAPEDLFGEHGIETPQTQQKEPPNKVHDLIEPLLSDRSPATRSLITDALWDKLTEPQQSKFLTTATPEEKASIEKVWGKK